MKKIILLIFLLSVVGCANEVVVEEQLIIEESVVEESVEIEEPVIEEIVEKPMEEVEEPADLLSEQGTIDEIEKVLG